MSARYLFTTRRRNWRWLFVPTGLLGFFWLLVMLAGAAGYRVNLTRSMPLDIYKLNKPTEPLQKGDLVEFCPPVWVTPVKFAFYKRGSCNQGGERLFKQVVATATDVVEVSDQGVFINGNKLPFSAPLNKPQLPQLRGRFELQPSQIWVFGFGASPELALHSFDSRYFGPIEKEAITGVSKARNTQ